MRCNIEKSRYKRFSQKTCILHVSYCSRISERPAEVKMLFEDQLDIASSFKNLSGRSRFCTVCLQKSGRQAGYGALQFRYVAGNSLSPCYSDSATIEYSPRYFGPVYAEPLSRTLIELIFSITTIMKTVYRNVSWERMRPAIISNCACKDQSYLVMEDLRKASSLAKKAVRRAARRARQSPSKALEEHGTVAAYRSVQPRRCCCNWKHWK